MKEEEKSLEMAHLTGDTTTTKEEERTPAQEDDGHHTVTLNEDLYAWFFLMQKTGKYGHLPCGYKWFYWFAVVITFLMQAFCLFALVLSFMYQFQQQMDDGEVSTYRMHGWVGEKAPIHFLCAVGGLFVMFCYLGQSIQPFIVLLQVSLNCADELTECTFHYGIWISLLNISMILVTWFFSLYLSYFGLYLMIEEPSAVLLTAIGNVFILEVDDGICQWLSYQMDAVNFNTEIKVFKKQYEKGLNSLTQMFLGVFVIILFLWSWLAADFYENVASSDDILKIEYMDMTEYTSYILIIGTMSVLGGTIAFGLYIFMPDLCQKIYSFLFWSTTSVMNIIWGCFLVPPGLEISNLSTAGIFRISMGCISAILLCYCLVCEYMKNFKKKENVKICQREMDLDKLDKVESILFYSCQFFPFCSAVSWVIEYNFEEGEPMICLLFGMVAVIFKKYVNDALKTEIKLCRCCCVKREC